VDATEGRWRALAPLRIDAAAAPGPDPTAEPDGFVVMVGEQDRIHFLDWGGPADDGSSEENGDESGGGIDPRRPGVVLIHGFASTAWVWAPVARRLVRARRTVAMDLRGHGLSDAPVEGYDPVSLAEDVIAVAEGGGLLDRADASLVLAGHGYGAMVAAWAAGALTGRCAGLILVDGGWDDLRASTGLEPDEFLREVEEPPEVLRSMRAFLRDRQGYDPASWDADQERAARSSVVELPSGRVEPATHPHVRAATVEAMFAYRPVEALRRVQAPIAAVVAGDDPARVDTLDTVSAALIRAGRPAIRAARLIGAGHNLMRYRPAEVAAAILDPGAAPLESP
jgi:2-(acetamidomethylene)succinate hydrolase